MQNLSRSCKFFKIFGENNCFNKGEKGAVAINGNEVAECGIKEDLKIVDLTEPETFLQQVFYGYANNMSIKESLDKGTEMSSKLSNKLDLTLKNYFFL